MYKHDVRIFGKTCMMDRNDVFSFKKINTLRFQHISMRFSL